MGQVGYQPRYICLRFISVSISCVINYLHAFGCVVGLHVSNCLHGQTTEDIYLFEVHLSWHILCHKLLAYIWVCCGVACVKLSPWSDNGRYLLEGLQVVANSCIMSNVLLTFAWAPLSPVCSSMHHWLWHEHH